LTNPSLEGTIVHRSKFCGRFTCIASLAAVTITGCHNSASSPAPPPLQTYEQAYAQAHARERAYAHGHASVGYAPDIITIPDHPFTAQRIYTEWRPEGSPDAPLVTTTVTIARDSAGRIHYESSRRPGDIDVLISDPVVEINYRYFIKPRQPVNPAAEECSQPLTSDITRRSSAQAGPFAARPSLQPVSFDPQAQPRYPQPKDRNDDLGTRDIEGVLAYGQHTQHTVSNQFGMKLMVIERWFSPDLGLNLLEVNAISGQNSSQIQTQDMQFSDPDSSLFVPPPSYSLPAKIPSCIRLTH
jgi:hypothetical protein